MHVHILGICGTFMGGIAAIAKSLGHKVTGSDANVYPPMSTQLTQLGIELTHGYDPTQLSPTPDIVVIGNAMSRGNPAVEYVLDNKIPYTSGPQWLLEHVLKDKWVLAVSGTHGKTTTSSMLAWILEFAQMQPGFLIGGVPGNFNLSARITDSPFFVIEADEYDSAFFDKRAKFVHYRPNTLIINNLEFDHADIYQDIQDIQRQFHHLLRMVPNNGLILSPLDKQTIQSTLEMGCWSELAYLGKEWTYAKQTHAGDQFDVYFEEQLQGTVSWPLIGDHNIHNAMMAIAAARHVGVKPSIAIGALAEFINVKRRLELRDVVNQIAIYDDFAHHPTAIATTLQGMRNKVPNQRIIAVLEPRSNTMKMGIHQHTLAQSWNDADETYIYTPTAIDWIDELPNHSSTPLHIFHDMTDLIITIAKQSRPNDHIVIMSNGGFDNIHHRLAESIQSISNT